MRYRDLKYGVKNLIRWFNVIFEDRDWDYYYFLVIMRKKIIHLRQYHEKYKTFEGWEKVVRQLKFCEKLVDRLINDDYYYGLPFIQRMEGPGQHYIINRMMDRDAKNLFDCIAKHYKGWWN